MRNRLFCNRLVRPLGISLHATWWCVWILVTMLGIAPRASAGGDAPQWMHALVNAPLPAHDEKTDAVQLYSETNVTVVSTDKVKRVVREAYKILRPAGRERGLVVVYFTAPNKVTALRGWCIPANGKDYEVKDKEAAEASAPKIEGSELISDLRVKLLRIPAPDPGNIVGYEYEVEEHPFVLQDTWIFQRDVPVRETRYSLQLPPGWEYKASWLNYPAVKPAQSGSSQSQWALNDVKEVRPEEEMPPMQGVTGQMLLSYSPPGGPSLNGFANWQEMGNWYSNLEKGRLEASPELKQRVTALTASASTPIEKARILAQFVQHDIRYVAIELGIGGWQPHAASDVFTHHYGDCKDKSALLRSMLRQINVESYPVAINTERGSVTPTMTAHRGFNHVIAAIKVPDETNDPTLVATLRHPKLGKILFFDPTNELTPFGQIGGHLQANYGLLVTADGGELVELPQQASAMNSIQRTAKLSLDPNGVLRGDVKEVRLGDRAWSQRWALRTVTKDADRIKPIERLLADSLSLFQITHASVLNMQHSELPFGFDYTFFAENYAKNSGDLLLVRPRVIGTKASPVLETKEPRRFPVEFEGPVLDTDRFEISLPQGYEVEDLPPPVNVDYGFASYHSKTEVSGPSIVYTRTFEVKELSVPVAKAEDLKRFYRIIASDERNTAVLRPIAK